MNKPKNANALFRKLEQKTSMRIFTQRGITPEGLLEKYNLAYKTTAPR